MTIAANRLDGSRLWGKQAPVEGGAGRIVLGLQKLASSIGRDWFQQVVMLECSFDPLIWYSDNVESFIFDSPRFCTVMGSSALSAIITHCQNQ